MHNDLGNSEKMCSCFCFLINVDYTYLSLNLFANFSQEEIESLREKMCAQTMLVVVGSSDDSLRVKRLNRSMEGISQSMIDNMIMVRMIYMYMWM